METVMAVQLSVAARNNRLDSLETTIGASATLRILSGAQPANCAAADSGTVLATIALPADYMSNAAAGSKAKLGTWVDNAADATGTAGYFRLYDTAGTTCHMQGNVTITGGGGDMTVDSVSFTTGQTFTVVTMTWNDANA
jgi:hypothetical protein